MKRNLTLPIILLLLPAMFSCNKKEQAMNTLTQAEKEGGWKLLFDGKTTDGWRSFRKEGVSGWTVENGTLKGLGEGSDSGGDIITVDQYENFELKLDWKLAPRGNSGIMYMVREDTFNVPYATGPEYQLLDDEDFPEPVEDWQLTAADYAMYVARDKKLNPAGTWNTAKIVVDHGHVEHWLNGQKVVEYELWSNDWKQRVAAGKWKDYPAYGSFARGHIALQDHGSLVWFRNIKIREL